ncbi:MAG: hypothetical protein KAF64_11705, partial [Hydrogenophaga sp.]|uniref:hypothetical protein n=1 Tax=Hydrogenophaga sp. TaxID=1904254 RepID=UPI0025BB2EF1
FFHGPESAEPCPVRPTRPGMDNNDLQMRIVPIINSETKPLPALLLFLLHRSQARRTPTTP